MHFRGVLVEPGRELVLGLQVQRGPIPIPARDLHMSCYACNDGVLRRTPWTTRNKAMWGSVGGACLELGSTHPMARELRDLGLPAKAVFSMTTGRLSATFGAPEVVEV